MSRSRSTVLDEEPQGTLTDESAQESAFDPMVGRHEEPPAWVAAELPAEHAEITRKIANLREEARKYERFAELLWRTGEPLIHGVRDVFSALGFRTDLAGETASYDLAVELDPGRRLLVEVLGGVSPLDKKAPEIARALRAIQQDAGPGDRVVFVVNIPCDCPVQLRQQAPATPDALRLIQGIGANLVATSTLFGFWRYSLQDSAGARKSVTLLHSLDGGMFR